MVRRVFLALLVFGFAACGDSPTEPQDVPGTYNLQTVNGSSLPFSTFWDIFSGESHYIAAWSITLNQDMTCSERVERNWTNFIGVQTRMLETETDVCTYTFDDGAITLTFPALTFPADVLTGSMSGSSLTITSRGDVFFFQK